MVNITTRSYDNYRTGTTLQETKLTTTYLLKNGINHLFDLPLTGDLRGTEGMPLIVGNLTMRDGLSHNVLYSATMANDIYAYDADTGVLIFKQRIGNPISNTNKIDMFSINDHWGCLATPVINMLTNTLFTVAMVSQDSTLNNSLLYLHAIDLVDGSEQAMPLNLNNATYTSPVSGVVSKMGNVPRKQRCGLAFVTIENFDLVVIANGSFNEDASTNQGWVIVVDVTSLRSKATTLKNRVYMNISACWTATVAPHTGGGIWQGGQGLTIADNGDILGMTGNGDFDGVENFGESFYRLRWNPPTNENASLKIVDWFTPFTDSGRVGGNPTLVSAKDVPNNDPQPGGTSNMDSPGDQDLNSGGPLFIAQKLTDYANDVICGAGKDGIAYIVNANNMGKQTNLSFASDKIQTEVYDKLLSPPYGFTYYPENMNLTPTDLSTLSTTFGGYTHHQHSTPVFYRSPVLGPMLFTGGENGPVRAFKFNSDFTLTYVAQSLEIASLGVLPPGGMPGTMMTLSANKNESNTGILWCLMPYGDANKTITDGRLIAYAADSFTSNGTLVKLWDSQDWAITFKHNKFNIPTVANGKIYVPSYDGRILVFG